LQITTKGVVLRDRELSNDSRLLTILTKERGVLHAFARPAKKLGGMAAATEFLSYSNFVLFQSKERYTVDKADSERIFFQLRQDLDQLSLASYLAELLIELGPEQEDAGEYLSLFLNCLHLMETKKRPVEQIKPLFELRLLSMTGYMPDLVGCQGCGTFCGEKNYFSPQQGCFYCQNCLPPSGEGLVPLSCDQLAALRHILYSDSKTLFQFRMSAAGLEQLGRITERYLKTQLGRTFASLDFYHSIHLPASGMPPEPENARTQKGE